MHRTSNTARHPTRRISIRHSLFLRFGLLGVGAVALLALGYLHFGIRPVVLEIAGSHFAAAAENVETSLTQLFLPAETLVGLARRWALDPGFSVEDLEEFNHLFRPVLEQSSQVSSVVAGTTEGEGWLLLQLPDGRWRNRVTDIPRQGMTQLFTEWGNDFPAETRRQVIDYDPRRRPWFTMAMAAPADGRVHWTAPYVFFTTGDPGITVSARQDLPDGRSLVVGLDIKLLDLSRATAAVQVGHRGYVLVLTPDQRVLGLPRPVATGFEGVRHGVLQPAEDLDLEPVRAGLTRWNHGRRDGSGILRYPAAGEEWLATFRPFHLGAQTFWVAVFAPEADFTPPLGPLAQAMAVILLLVLGVTLFLARRQARRFSAPLEALAAASGRIARLDFTEEQPPPTALAEIQVLADAQVEMRRVLRRFHETVEAQAASLREQIAALRSTESQLRKSEARLQEALAQEQAILDNALVGIFFVRNRTIVRHNRRLAELLGYSEEGLADRSTEILYESRDVFLTIGNRAYKALKRDRKFAEELWFPRRDGSRFWGHLSGHAVDPAAPEAGSVWILADFTERKQAQERLEYLSQHDPLTDLPNRLLLNDRLSHAIHRTDREHDLLALFFIDLDHFKTVNDTLGHEVGDRLLCVAAGELKACLRASDTLSRLGGDEFIILVEGVEAPAAIADLAGRLIKVFSVPFTVDDRQIYITGSIGISVYPDDGADPATLVRNADAAMYQAKAQGRNTYHFYSKEMTRKAIARMEMESRLRHALENDGLEIHLQPQLNLSDGRLVGAEALVRLRHPERGLVGPLEFIPIAEETGLISQLGRWVLEQSCRHWLTLAGEGFRLPRLGVNFSVKQLQRGNFLEMINDVLGRTGLPPSVLELEITESFLLETEGALDLLRSLGEGGVTLAIDDFGTGYSSLSYLRQLPFGKLKIDRSFIRDIGRNPDGEALVRTIISLAATLGLEVIAEGVETPEQMAFLLREGCHQAQGFLFARPMSLSQFRQWLRERAALSAPALN